MAVDGSKSGSAGSAPSRSEAIGTVWRHARRHASVGGIGLLGTICVVATRIALPWPLRGVIEAAFPQHEGNTFLGRFVPAGVDPVLFLCGVYLVLAIASGLAELVQRLWTMRFVSQTVHDLRASALTAVRRGAGRSEPADLITRVVGDSARLKTNLFGILVHVSQNGLFIVGITALFLFLAPKLGLLLLLSGMLAVLVGYRAVDEVAETSFRQRQTESRFAVRVHRATVASEGSDTDELNRKSLRKHVRTTRLLGLTTLWIHSAVACVISLALWIGVKDVRAGTTEPGELFLFIAYALMSHRRAVRVGRQVARSGKVVANAQRLCALMQASDTDPAPLASPGVIRLEGVCCRAPRSHRRRNRLGPVDLTIPAGARVAVLGSTGAGKSTLLDVLAGRAAPDKGRLSWDDQDLTGALPRLRTAVAHLPQEPRLPTSPLQLALGLDAGGPRPEQEELLGRLGVTKLARRLRKGLDTSLDPDAATLREQRTVALAAIALGEDHVWVLDSPTDSCSRGQRERLAAVLEQAGNRIVIAAFPTVCLIEHFSLVVVLHKGKVAFCGAPQSWKEWKIASREEHEVRT